MTDMTVDQFLDFTESLADFMENGSFAPALEQCRYPLAYNFVVVFNNEEGSGGEAWPPHAPATVRMHGPHPLLRLTYTMFRSLLGPGEGHYELVGDREIDWGTTVIYNAVQNFGSADGRIPAREYMYWTEPGIDGCMVVLSQYLMDDVIDKLISRYQSQTSQATAP